LLRDKLSFARGGEEDKDRERVCFV